MDKSVAVTKSSAREEKTFGTWSLVALSTFIALIIAVQAGLSANTAEAGLTITAE